MRKRFYSVVLGAAVLILGPVAAAHAGLTIVREVGDEPDAPTVKQTYYVEGHRLAVITDDGSGEIFDIDRQLVWTYNTRLKMFSKTTVDKAEVMVKRARKMNERMRRTQLDRLPPDKRMEVEAELAAREANPSLKQMGKDKIVGKWRCTPVVEYIPSSTVPIETLCVASFGQLGITEGDRKILKNIEKTTDRFAGHFGGPGRRIEGALKKIGIEGMPVEIRHSINGVTTVVSVSHGAISPSVFEVPTGLREAPIP